MIQISGKWYTKDKNLNKAFIESKKLLEKYYEKDIHFVSIEDFSFKLQKGKNVIKKMFFAFEKEQIIKKETEGLYKVIRKE